MKYIIKYLVALIIIFLLLIIYNRKKKINKDLKNEIKIESNFKIENENYKEFNNYFILNRNINFNLNNLIIGEISKFIPLSKKIFIIFDKISDEIFWINLSKYQYKKLSVEEKFPGHKIKLAGIFKEDSLFFWISSYPQYYFQFNNSGNLVDFIKFKNRRVSFKFVVDVKNRLIGYYRNLNKKPNIIFYDLTKQKETKKFSINFPEEYLNQIYRTVENVGLLINNNNIYISNAIENKIYLYDSTGIFKNAMESSYNFFKKMKIPNAKIKKEIINFFQENSNFSMFINMYFLNDNTIIALYAINGRPYIELFSIKTRRPINKKPIILPYHLVYAEKNSIYLVKQSMSKVNKFVNPEILVYRMKSK